MFKLLNFELKFPHNFYNIFLLLLGFNFYTQLHISYIIKKTINSELNNNLSLKKKTSNFNQNAIMKIALVEIQNNAVITYDNTKDPGPAKCLREHNKQFKNNKWLRIWLRIKATLNIMRLIGRAKELYLIIYDLFYSASNSAYKLTVTVLVVINGVSLVTVIFICKKINNRLTKLKLIKKEHLNDLINPNDKNLIQVQQTFENYKEQNPNCLGIYTTYINQINDRLNRIN